MDRGKTIRSRPETPADRLEADERGLEWDAALLKARRSVRQPHRLRRALSGDGDVVSCLGKAFPGIAHASAVATREQESLFECLRASAGLVGRSWLCTIEGTGDRMRVCLAERVSTRVAWRCTGSSAQVLVAFADWLWKRPEARG